MKNIFIVLLIANSAWAKNVEDCLSEAIETNLVLKVSAMTHSEGGAHCGNVEAENVRELGEQRENKIRFKDKVIRAFKRTKEIDLHYWSDFEEQNPGKADEAKTCAYLNLKTNAAIRNVFADKYPKLKDCPAAVTALKKSLRDSQVLHVPLYEICRIVLKAEDDMKNALGSCKTEEPVAEEKKPEVFQRADISFGSSNRSRAARATEQ